MAETTIAVLEGDETGQELLDEALRVLDPEVSASTSALERFDLSLESRLTQERVISHNARCRLRGAANPDGSNPYRGRERRPHPRARGDAPWHPKRRGIQIEDRGDHEEVAWRHAERALALGDHEHVRNYLGTAAARLERITIDGAFVQRKLARVNTLVRAKPSDAPERARAGNLTGSALQAFMDGRYAGDGEPASQRRHPQALRP